MDYLQIKGAKNLEGKIAISGAKNAALPIIAMTILAKNRVKIQNTPQVADIKTSSMSEKAGSNCLKSSDNFL